MKILKHLLTLVAFGYLCYHIYTFGPGMFNVTVLVILVLSSIANYFREKRESDLKANENARKARAEARMIRFIHIHDLSCVSFISSASVSSYSL